MNRYLKGALLAGLLSSSLDTFAFQTDSVDIKNALRVFNEVKVKYAPDKRTEVANVQISGASPLTVAIETTKPALVADVKAALMQASISAVVTADTLPAKALNGKLYAIANLSVCNNRVMPGNAAEMVTQILLGTPVMVLKKQSGYYLVRSPDNYISWVDGGGLTLMDKTEFEAWQKTPKVIYTAQYGHAFDQPSDKGLPVSDLVAGDILQVAGKEKGFLKVIYPDQRVGYIKKDEAADFTKWLAIPNPDADKILTTAKTLIGVPYLWGGTSIKGVDCSGFTKSCYFLNGVIIPRDASQQALVGDSVDIYEGNTDSISIDKCLKNLQPGDLLFFSSGMKQGKLAKITHTAIYMGDGQFIQSAGMVKINSLKQDAPNFDQYRLDRLVKARRMLNSIGKPEIIKVSNHSFYTENTL
ncbi:C40 family peptidase [Mucilaginibacter agri]|uniref:Glycoside hydrolase n=1 Tax=Mucilaginibacter agri TaxID=2695265 RepID=A0A965ZJS6_9SPHI|nr:C40 family peptidase [Mucilaginibacter agri]NCD70997.1 glycoside hydrolase [Mucilaginibacter agri]